MKSVIICEGQDDLWFLAYYLHKKCHWNALNRKNEFIKKTWSKYKIPENNKCHVEYMISDNSVDTLAIVSSNGQDAIESVVNNVRVINARFSDDPISKLIIFRDCDERNPDDVAENMNVFFEQKIDLKNRKVSHFNENNVDLEILPIVIPFNESGAIETLLMQSIKDSGREGSYVVTCAKKYIEEARENVQPVYLKSLREQTKAKYSAALSIINPTRSRDNFQELMLSCPWEDSPSIEYHMSDLKRILEN